MSCVWPEFTFPFPPDLKLLKKQEKSVKAQWSEQCMRDLELFLTINHSNEFTGEDFRQWCLEKLGRTAPADGRTWSAVWCGAVKSGKIEHVRKTMMPCKMRADRKKITTNVYKRKYA